jgi:glycosyltransferase involved in cell wall biosynthesis
MTKPIRKIALIGQFLFPSGSASAARIRNLALGFVENGCEVSVIPTSPLSRNASNIHKSFPGVTVYTLSHYPGDGFVPQRNSLFRKPLWLFSCKLAALRSKKVVSGLLREDACDLAIFYGRSWSILSPSLSILRKSGVTTLVDIVELPSQFGGLGGTLSPIYWDWQRMRNKIPSHFDGVLTISRGLQDHYKSRGCEQTLVVPSIEGWENGKSGSIGGSRKNEKLRILYLGALIERDSPSSIAKLISSLNANGFRQFEVRIAGKYGETSEGRNVEKIWRNDDELRSNITFLGRLSEEELAIELERADLFLLTRKNTIEERCACPTRLVEYIKANHPVVVSNVGDIGLYLEDCVSAVFLDDDKPQESAIKIIQIARDRDSMANISRNAYNVGEKSFNRKMQCGRIVEFAAKLMK